MNKKHTKGPWKVFEDDFYTVGVESEGSVIADHLFESNDLTIEDIKQELYANAKLIAAAPDLLEACKMAFAIINRDKRALPHVTSVLKGAIKKAGE